MRMPTLTGGLLSADMASTATRTTFDRPPLRFYSTEETNSKRSPIQYVLYYSSFFWRNNLLAAPSCRRVVETKSGQNMVFDPGGSKGRLHAYPFLETWHALLCGEVYVRVLEEAAALFGGWMIRES